MEERKIRNEKTFESEKPNLQKLNPSLCRHVPPNTRHRLEGGRCG